MHAGRAYANLVSMAVSQRIPKLAARYVPEGTEYCEEHEVHDCLSYIRAYAAHHELNCGRWNEAAQLAGGLIERHSPAIAQRLPALVVLSLVRARRGDPGVEQLLDEAMRLALPTGELQRIGRVAAAGAEVAWYRGDSRRVAEQVGIGLQVAAAGGRDCWIHGELIFWGRRAGLTLEVPSHAAAPYALMIAGQWAAAAAAWKDLGMPYEQALALAEGPEDALREALGIIEHLGAGPLGAIVRQRLRERGIRGVSRGPRTSTRGNPAGLTSREVQVLTLLVRGHTNTELANRLHVSTRTVDHHVSSILEKLEVRSRTEAVAAAFGLGIIKPGV
jgi:DNA-binding CsgD family transcriptional regulator